MCIGEIFVKTDVYNLQRNFGACRVLLVTSEWPTISAAALWNQCHVAFWLQSLLAYMLSIFCLLTERCIPSSNTQTSYQCHLPSPGSESSASSIIALLLSIILPRASSTGTAYNNTPGLNHGNHSLEEPFILTIFFRPKECIPRECVRACVYVCMYVYFRYILW